MLVVTILLQLLSLPYLNTSTGNSLDTKVELDLVVDHEVSPANLMCFVRFTSKDGW
jgi:hypothetical protein